jgi:BirA family biotin operon repressor/biotin-[acetyl-CoA-carboxylase] ligase
MWIIEKHQSAGRGRLSKRNWQDERGKSLLMSLILKEAPRAFVELAPYIAALSVSDSIRAVLRGYLPSFEQTRVRIKWPNDLILDGKKCCGILSEAVWNGDELRAVVIGIGMNVNQQRFEDSLKLGATSLFGTVKRPLDLDQVRDRVLAAISNYLERSLSVPMVAFRTNVLNELRIELGWMKLLPPFEVELQSGETIGMLTYRGIEPDGGMKVVEQNGTERLLYSGTLAIPDLPEVIR